MLITDTSQIDTYYRALVERARDYIGVFFVGVRTTGVFCIASCNARKPKLENVEFYSQFKDALDAGFRPCKICRPTENSHTAPAMVVAAIDLARHHLKARITDWDLKQRDISPELVRRWFLKHHGMTFQAFQRMLRINHALQELKTGRRRREAGEHDSLHGLAYTYKKPTGSASSEAAQVILIHRFTTQLGPMFVCATEKGVCLLEFVDRRALETEFNDLQRLLKAPIVDGENDHIRQAVQEMGEYFSGQRTEFSVALDLPGSEFQRSVWQILQTVPYGQTASYMEQAERLGRPSAVRAVASANGANRVSIIVPCHRVIGKDGSLIGYGGGLPRKRWLLDHEKRHAMQGQLDLLPSH
ncbi:bifunctional transcriptional activator/DNA repair enzyme AdaA [Chitinimonas lacunae]|uniref:Methylated-DNA--protein-cysteine methyltransferase n=1 Tax=Chitinimonas lacunae TaxID=1963018 RepID=A0ABV8MV66_9NEIS